MAEAHCEPCRG